MFAEGQGRIDLAKLIAERFVAERASTVATTASAAASTTASTTATTGGVRTKPATWTESDLIDAFHARTGLKVGVAVRNTRRHRANAAIEVRVHTALGSRVVAIGLAHLRRIRRVELRARFLFAQ